MEKWCTACKKKHPIGAVRENRAEDGAGPDQRRIQNSAMTTCKHMGFHANVAVVRLEDTGGFVAEVRIECAECHLPFQFLGLPLGLDLNGATMRVDGQEARLAIAPVGSVPQPLDKALLAGFRVKMPGDH